MNRRIAHMLGLGLLWLSMPGTAQDSAWITLKGQAFLVELAATPETRAQGLMYRTELAPDRGMLFVYPTARELFFWMRNTLVPLDILFFDSHGRLVKLHEHAPPCRVADCPYFPSEAPAQYVVELAAGTAKTLGIAPGDQLKIGRQ